MRLNPITYGLRARDVILPSEDPAEYRQLWADLEAEWQPETRTERLHLEQMAIAQWLLARLAKGESRIYEAALPLEKQLALLDRVSTQRVRLEHSFRDAMRELKQIATGTQGPATAPTAKANRASRKTRHSDTR